ncbi:MAG: hypothetical protein ACPG8W_21585 [Candidatus Promineifilaceae bacterium]
MEMTQLVRKLGRNDLKLIGRDSFLMMMFIFVIIIAIACRFALPALNDYFIANEILPNAAVNQSLADFYPLIIAFMVIFNGATITGAIFGFSLLDEKDDNTIKAMLVTPVPMSHYLMYRVAVPTILAGFIVVLEVLFVNQALIPLWQLILISAGAALASPIAVLFYGISAENKVQGFAYAKFVSIAGWIILGGWFVPEPMQWLFGLFPPFWISKAYWMAYDGATFWWVALLVGIIYQLVVLKWLMGWFTKVAHR